MTWVDDTEEMSWCKFKIADHQLQVQHDAMDVQIVHMYSRMTPHSSPETWALYEELKELRSQIRVAGHILREKKVKPATRWGKIVYGVYKWAVADRFDDGTSS